MFVSLIFLMLAAVCSVANTVSTTITTMVIQYAFPRKPSDELFPCVYSTAYSYLPGCCLHNSLTPRISTLSLLIVRYRLSGYPSCVPQQLNSRQNGEFCGHRVESLLGSLVLSSVYSRILSPTCLLTRQEVIM